MSDTYNIEEAETPETLILPLDSWHRERGGRMVEFAGYWMPVQYEGIMAEHLWTREHAGLFDVSHMGQLYLAGEGLDAAVEALLPIDLSTLKVGRQRYSLLLNEEGGVLDDLMVTRWNSGLYMVVNGATKWDDIGHLREYLPDEITLSHLEEAALLALQGPEAALALASLGLTPAQPQIVAVDELGFMQSGPYLWNGVEIHASRSGYTGEDGYEISLPAEHAAAFADALCAHPSVKPIGLGARDSLRMEAGLPLYGHDLNEQIDPISAGLTFGINKRRRVEGGFPGAERIQAALAEGTATKRIGLTLQGRQAAREGAEVYHGEEKVGVLTSGGFAPSLGKPIAMADVPAALATPGTELFIDVRGKKLPAIVTPMPFVPHRYFRKGAA
ncbi:glycine cleavage system aminomethyltransferase GcvT [Novosphingobium umbonatum]|uniref:aminomethyltransferase n=1 Tax=Novosphingobium umbonatum TaxID=1908524 RepID=A0A437N8W6_9SPHN|nr:glycine cleavage system aminomethyltransferase GcvT [Novosphingobium umbonatum]RVU06376.1 glycine cleavage system aminomethyltransferase GcvT [Novosphingobium umbonatum]